MSYHLTHPCFLLFLLEISLDAIMGGRDGVGGPVSSSDYITGQTELAEGG